MADDKLPSVSQQQVDAVKGFGFGGKGGGQKQPEPAKPVSNSAPAPDMTEFPVTTHDAKKGTVKVTARDGVEIIGTVSGTTFEPTQISYKSDKRPDNKGAARDLVVPFETAKEIEKIKGTEQTKGAEKAKDVEKKSKTEFDIKDGKLNVDPSNLSNLLNPTKRTEALTVANILAQNPGYEYQGVKAGGALPKEHDKKFAQCTTEMLSFKSKAGEYINVYIVKDDPQNPVKPGSTANRNGIVIGMEKVSSEDKKVFTGAETTKLDESFKSRITNKMPDTSRVHMNDPRADEIVPLLVKQGMLNAEAIDAGKGVRDATEQKKTDTGAKSKISFQSEHNMSQLPPPPSGKGGGRPGPG